MSLIDYPSDHLPFVYTYRTGHEELGNTLVVMKEAWWTRDIGNLKDGIVKDMRHFRRMQNEQRAIWLTIQRAHTELTIGFQLVETIKKESIHS